MRYMEEEEGSTSPPPTVADFLSLLTRHVVPSMLESAPLPKPFILGLFRRRSPAACLSASLAPDLLSLALLDLAAPDLTGLDSVRVLVGAEVAVAPVDDSELG